MSVALSVGVNCCTVKNSTVELGNSKVHKQTYSLYHFVPQFFFFSPFNMLTIGAKLMAKKLNK